MIKESLDTVAGPGCAAEILNATETMSEWWGQETKRARIKTMFQ